MNKPWRMWGGPTWSRITSRILVLSKQNASRMKSRIGGFPEHMPPTPTLHALWKKSHQVYVNLMESSIRRREKRKRHENGERAGICSGFEAITDRLPILYVTILPGLLVRNRCYAPVVCNSTVSASMNAATRKQWGFHWLETKLIMASLNEYWS